MRLRVRGPNGVANITLPDTATIGDLKREISNATSIPMFDLKAGFPPKTLELDQFDDELLITNTGLKLDGEQLIATPHDIAGPLKQMQHADSPTSNAATNLPPTYNASNAASTSSSKSSSGPLPLTRKANDVESDPPEVPFPLLQGTLVLRVSIALLKTQISTHMSRSCPTTTPACSVPFPPPLSANPSTQCMNYVPLSQPPSDPSPTSTAKPY